MQSSIGSDLAKILLLSLLCFSRASLPRNSEPVKQAIGLIKGDKQNENRRRLLNSAGEDASDPTGARMLEKAATKAEPWYADPKAYEDEIRNRPVLNAVSFGKGEFESAMEGNLRGGRRLWSSSTCGSYGGQDSYSTYAYSSSYDICQAYGGNCAEGGGSGSGSQDENCAQRGFAFLGLSFSVQDFDGEIGCPKENFYPGRMDESVNYGNPHTWRINDQLPVQCLIDRTYKYSMSADLDGWLVGGGINMTSFDGKMPYIDSSHTELYRVGSLDENQGGMSTEYIYSVMENIYSPPFFAYPKYVKLGGGGNDGELKLAIMDTYSDGYSCVDEGQYCGCPGEGESEYEHFSECIITMFGEAACSDGDMTDPHMSMVRGMNMWSADHMTEYLSVTNIEVAKWQKAYPYGVAIGNNRTDIWFMDDDIDEYGQSLDWGGCYFFFGRVMITNHFKPSRNLTDEEMGYATYTLYNDFASEEEIGEIYYGSGSGSGDVEDWDCTTFDNDSDNWDTFTGPGLPCGCTADGEAFLGVPLGTYVQLSTTAVGSGGYYEHYQSYWDLGELTTGMYNWIEGFDSNHATTTGIHVDTTENGYATIVEESNPVLKIFKLGNVDEAHGGMSMENVIEIVRKIKFDAILLKPAYVGSYPNGDIVLYWEMVVPSALSELFDLLCEALGHPNDGGDGSDTSKNYCATPTVNDNAYYGCHPDAQGGGPFCLYTTILYAPIFADGGDEGYLEYANNICDSWRFDSYYDESAGSYVIDYSSPKDAVAPYATINADGKEVSNSGYTGLCEGNKGCLTLFYSPMNPIGSFPPCNSNQEFIPHTTQYIYGSDLVGDVSYHSDMEAKGSASAKRGLLLILQFGLTLSAVVIVSFGGLIAVRKVKRRRKKGVSFSQMLFGRRRKKKGKDKVKKEKGRGKNKDKGMGKNDWIRIGQDSGFSDKIKSEKSRTKPKGKGKGKGKGKEREISKQRLRQIEKEKEKERGRRDEEKRREKKNRSRTASQSIHESKSSTGAALLKMRDSTYEPPTPDVSGLITASGPNLQTATWVSEGMTPNFSARTAPDGQASSSRRELMQGLGVGLSAPSGADTDADENEDVRSARRRSPSQRDRGRESESEMTGQEDEEEDKKPKNTFLV